MTTEEFYIYVSDLVNKNSTNGSVDLSKRLFVSLFKENAVRYIELLLKTKSLDSIRKISNFIQNKELTEVANEDIYNEYNLPKDYLFFVNISSTLESEKCLSGIETEVMNEIRPEEIDKYYSDPYNEPSISAAETIYIVRGNGIQVYKKGFEISKVTLSYYRKPIDIDIAGYKRLDGNVSTTINSDFQLPALLDVGIMMAKQFAGVTENTTSYQVLNNMQG